MRFYFKLIFILLFSFNIYASQLNNAQTEILNEVEEYLKTLQNVSFDIKQTDNNKNIHHGALFISKPNNFRWNYYEPYPLLIVGNSSFVTIYDYEMKQATNISASENIFAFLVNDTKINEDFEILDIYSSNSQYNIIIKHKEFDKKAHLVFSNKPLKIRNISIIDVDLSNINIEFSNCKNVSFINKELFTIKNPDIFGEPKRYNKNEIEKQYKIIR